MSDIKNRVEFAKLLAMEAGEILAQRFGGRQKGRMKSQREVVTDTDIESEEHILRRIEDEFGEPVLSEEFNPDTHSDGPLWIIDPLDGTNNFACGFPFFSVLIAFAENGKTKLGIIYEPIRKNIFWSDGVRSYVGTELIAVSKTKKLGDVIAATGFPYNRGEGCRSNLENFVRITTAVRGIRRAGSAGLDLAYTAAGVFDLYWELALKPWDIAAGELIVRCAGGSTSQCNGLKWEIGRDTIIAANPIIFEKARKLISDETL